MGTRLTKPQRELLDIIRQEGGSILSVRAGGSHILVDYELPTGHVFTQGLPKGSKLSPRWAANFRRAIRNTRRSINKD